MARRNTLRVALLSMIEPAVPGTAPRAFLRVGGVSIARQQLGLVLALAAERIVCLAAGMSAELVQLQHAAAHQALASVYRQLGKTAEAQAEEQAAARLLQKAN